MHSRCAPCIKPSRVVNIVCGRQRKQKKRRATHQSQEPEALLERKVSHCQHFVIGNCLDEATQVSPNDTYENTFQLESIVEIWVSVHKTKPGNRDVDPSRPCQHKNCGTGPLFQKSPSTCQMHHLLNFSYTFFNGKMLLGRHIGSLMGKMEAIQGRR